MYTTKKYYEADKKYYKDRARLRILKNRKIIDAIKNGPCVDCGNTFPPCAMDFDHRGNKLDSVSRLVSNGFSINKIMEEIAKCDLVCANCHRIRTHK